jgi:hypothetical protein
MLSSIPKPKKIAKASSSMRLGVNVKLTPADHKKASLVAKAGRETLPEWISSLVNTALMP